MKLIPRTIKLKLIYGMSVVIACVFMINIYISVNEYTKIDENMKQELSDLIQVSKVSILQPLWNYDTETIDAIIDSVLLTDFVAKVNIVDTNNHIIAGRIKENLMKQEDQLYHKEDTFVMNDTVIGYIEIDISSYFVEKEIISNMIMKLLIILIQLFITICLLIYLSDRITKPLSDLKLVANKIANGILNNEINISSQDEIGEFGIALTKMQTQLENNTREIHDKLFQLEEQNVMITKMNHRLEKLVSDVSENYKSTVLALANSIEANDAYTRGHCERVSYYSILIAVKMNLDKHDIEILEYAAALHDIGKISVPHHILNKNTKLTIEEFECIKLHSQVGYEIIKDIEFLKDSALIVLEHHEKEDGSGYPNGLTSEEISLSSKILCIADAFDAMTSSRVYRKYPMEISTAVNQLRMFSGSQFNKEVVDCFIEALIEVGEYSES